MDIQRIENLKRRRDAAQATKDRLEGKLESAKARFKEEVQRVRDAGYDPRTIKDTLSQKESELEEACDQLDAQLTSVEEQLNAFSEGTTA